MNEITQRLADALRHMQHCRSCAEGSWENCEGGEEALAALAALDAPSQSCPDCGGMGFYAVGDTDNPRQEQCQWCAQPQEDVEKLIARFVELNQDRQDMKEEITQLKAKVERLREACSKEFADVEKLSNENATLRARIAQLESGWVRVEERHRTRSARRAMSDLRIQVCEWLGWKVTTEACGIPPQPTKHSKHHGYDFLPDLTLDLMAQAEARLTDEEHRRFRDIVSELTYDPSDDVKWDREYYSPPVEKRATALLRAVGKGEG